MFVRQSTHNRVRSERDEFKALATIWKLKYSELMSEWNALVGRLNKLGGEEFLSQDHKKTQFSDDEIKKLLQLCHPDKHGGKQLAVDMTAKLLQLRG